MKRFLAFLLPLLMILGCEEVQPAPEAIITLDSEQADNFIISSDGGVFDVSFTSVLDWTAGIVYESGGEGWASLNKASGKGGYDIVRLKVSVQNNQKPEKRSAKIVITSGDKTARISFEQDGHEEPIQEEPVFKLSDREAEVGAEGGIIYVTVSHNVDYRCEISADWIKEINTKTVVEDVHAFEISPNTVEESRSAVISFVGDGETVSFTVTQMEYVIPIFELLENSAEVESEGGLVTVAVNTNIEYDYTITADWVREVVTRSGNSFEHTFEVLENTESKDRTAVISFCGNDTCLPFTITQKGYKPVYKLEVDVKDISVAASGTEVPYVVNVQSDADWNVSSNASWCTVDPSSGTNDGSFAVSVAENTSSEPRTATVTVSVADGSVVRKIGIIQAPKASDSGDDSWKDQDFVHKSLALRFTADWCGYCPMMATAMAKAQEQLPDKLEVISVHGGGSGLASEASNALTNYYGIGSFPTGYVDGYIQIGNYDISTTASNIVAAVKQTEEEYDTYTGVSWTSSVSGNQIILNLSAYIKKAGSYKITALLVEDNIVGYQADYTNGSSDIYVHTGVLRAAFSDVEGDSFEITEDFQKKDFAYSVDVPSGCDVDNMRIVVFIQRKDGRCYVDNTASASVGKERPLVSSSGNWGSGNEIIVPGDDITL